ARGRPSGPCCAGRSHPRGSVAGKPPAGRCRAARGGPGALAGAQSGGGAAMNISWGKLEELPVEQRQRWSAARVWAAHQAPYLATAVLALQPVVVKIEGGPIPGLDLR